jgi:hypothetical protein
MSSGNIPETLGNLRSLQNLQLWRNQLSGMYPRISRSARRKSLMTSLGNIPETFGNLTKLTVLDLAVNQLSGMYPAFIQICVP